MRIPPESFRPGAVRRDVNAIDPTLSWPAPPPEPSLQSRIYDARRRSLGAWLRAAEAVDEARALFRESQRMRRKLAQDHPMLVAKEPEGPRSR